MSSNQEIMYITVLPLANDIIWINQFVLISNVKLTSLYSRGLGVTKSHRRVRGPRIEAIETKVSFPFQPDTGECKRNETLTTRKFMKSKVGRVTS